MDLALDWVSDIFLNSKLDQKEIEQRKGGDNRRNKYVFR